MPQDSSRTIALAPDLPICRILNGLWQVAGAHGRIAPKAALQAMFHYLDAGFTTWDLADHYGPAEDFIGEFRRQLQATRGTAAPASIQALTKWVPQTGKMTRQRVEESVDTALRRMDTTTLDLLQFHWWDYGDRNFLDALKYLTDLQQEGKIRHLGLTNFDTEHLHQVIDSGVPIVSNQVQYSLIDRRPQVQLAQFCQQHQIQLLTYGTVGGGFLSEKYLGQKEPNSSALNTLSLRKYKQVIDTWGGWDLFQALLQTLAAIAQKHQASIANVAVRYILDQPAVAGVIIGARLGLSDHLSDNAAAFQLNLDSDDQAQIEAISSQAADLFQCIGDCGSEYRQ
jgi:aryl-alcohol dehydrogenase-like predicted oxidoreductase